LLVTGRNCSCTVAFVGASTHTGKVFV